MTPFSNDGTIRQQGIQARNIARQAIAKAIAEEAQRTGVLVSNTIGRITMNQLAPKSVEDLWNDIQMDETLAMIQRKADANVADYPGFSGWLNGERMKIRYGQMKRLYDSVGDRNYQRQFANTVGFRPAFA